MLLPLRHARTWLVIGWVLVMLAIAASVMPVQQLPHPPGIDDKVEHTVAYALLSLWFTGIYPRSRYVLIALGLFVMGIVIEWAQSVMQLGRQGDIKDVLANSIGIAFGVTLSLLWLGGWAQRVETWTKRS